MDGEHNNPWSEMYSNWPARNEKEAKALEMLSQAIDFKTIREQLGMSYKEWRDFYNWAKQYETEHLCVPGEWKGE